MNIAFGRNLEEMCKQIPSKIDLLDRTFPLCQADLVLRMRSALN